MFSILIIFLYNITSSYQKIMLAYCIAKIYDVAPVRADRVKCDVTLKGYSSYFLLIERDKINDGFSPVDRYCDDLYGVLIIASHHYNTK